MTIGYCDTVGERQKSISNLSQKGNILQTIVNISIALRKVSSNIVTISNISVHLIVKVIKFLVVLAINAISSIGLFQKQESDLRLLHPVPDDGVHRQQEEEDGQPGEHRGADLQVEEVDGESHFSKEKRCFERRFIKNILFINPVINFVELGANSITLKRSM